MPKMRIYHDLSTLRTNLSLKGFSCAIMISRCPPCQIMFQATYLCTLQFWDSLEFSVVVSFCSHHNANSTWPLRKTCRFQQRELTVPGNQQELASVETSMRDLNDEYPVYCTTDHIYQRMLREKHGDIISPQDSGIMTVE